MEESSTDVVQLQKVSLENSPIFVNTLKISHNTTDSTNQNISETSDNAEIPIHIIISNIFPFFALRHVVNVTAIGKSRLKIK